MFDTHIDHTEEYSVSAPDHSTCKIFINKQFDGHWVASVLYFDDGELQRVGHVDTGREGAYIKAAQWIVNSISDLAVIEPLK